MTSPLDPVNGVTPTNTTPADSSSSDVGAQILVAQTLHTLHNLATTAQNTSSPSTSSPPSSSAPTVGSGFNIPENPNSSDFDTSIPTNANGSVDVDAMLQKFYNFIYYTKNGDIRNFNVYSDLAAYIMNISQVYGSLSAADQAKVNTMMGPALHNHGGTLSSPQLLADNLVYGTFYTEANNGVPPTQIMADIHKLVTAMQGFSGSSNPWFAGMASELNLDYKNMPAYMQQHLVPNGQGGYTADMSDLNFFFSQARINANLFYPPSSNTNQWIDLFHYHQIIALEQQIKDPFLLFIYLMYMLTNQDNDAQVQIGGFGNLLDNLSDWGNKAGATVKAYQAGAPQASGGGYSANQIQTIIENLQDIGNQLSFPDSATVQSQIAPAMQDFFGTGGTGVQIPAEGAIDPQTGQPYPQNSFEFNDVDYAGKSVGDLIAAVEAAPAADQSQGWATIAYTFNQLTKTYTPPPVGNPPIPQANQTIPTYATFLTDLNSIASATSQLSNLITTQSQQASSAEQKLLAFIEAGFQNIISQEQQMTQAQKVS